MRAKQRNAGYQHGLRTQSYHAMLAVVMVHSLVLFMVHVSQLGRTGDCFPPLEVYMAPSGTIKASPQRGII